MSETIPFEILGHFEEIIDKETGKCYGTYPACYGLGNRPIHSALNEPPPPYGYQGRRERLFKKGEVIQIDKAHKGLQPYKFKSDALCYIITHPICGRMVPRA